MKERNFRFSYTFVDIRELRPDRLLKSGNLGDAVLAVLCDDVARTVKIREVLNRITEAADPVAAADALLQLRILTKLRGGGALVEEEIEAMGVTVNVEDRRMLRQPIDRAREQGRKEGREEGMAEMVARLLSIRFRGAMPIGVDLSEHFQGLKPEVLRDILDRGVTSDRVEAAFGTHMPASPLPGFK